MKKKLEADLISIAHRILKLKNKSELVQLQQETQKLYEKLSVLLFVEENFADVKPTIGYADIQKKLEEVFDSPVAAVVIAAPKVEIQTEAEIVSEVDAKEGILAVTSTETFEEETIPEIEFVQAEITEVQEQLEAPQSSVVVEEKAEQEVAPVVAQEKVFRPAFELAFESKKENVKEEVKNNSAQISFDDLLGPNYSDPVFVKPEELEQITEAPLENLIPIHNYTPDAVPVPSLNKFDTESKIVSLNDRISKGITIGLNDRIAFMKHLFANSSEDYNRVLSQLITFDTMEEAQSFINDMVKPDYNNWVGKEEYESRFMEILEKRFS